MPVEEGVKFRVLQPPPTAVDRATFSPSIPCPLR